MTAPLFGDEGPAYYAAAYAHNAPFATGGPYFTTLTPPEEQQFRAWVQQAGVPFDVNAGVSDYDMRGFWKAGGSQGWRRGLHFPDTYKTPYDTTFSRESRYATPNCPFTWQGDNLVDVRDGTLIFGTPAPSRPPARRASGGPAGQNNGPRLVVRDRDGRERPVPISGSGDVRNARVPLRPGEQLWYYER